MAVTNQGGVTPPIVISLDKQRKKHIKDLKQGRGKLMADIDAAVDEVRESLGVESAGRQLVPIVLIYERKRRRRRDTGLPLPFPFDR